MTVVTINGEQKEIEESWSLGDLIEVLDLPTTRIAVELNRKVVRKQQWRETKISNSDVIEVVHFVGGG